MNYKNIYRIIRDRQNGEQIQFIASNTIFEGERLEKGLKRLGIRREEAAEKLCLTHDGQLIARDAEEALRRMQQRHAEAIDKEIRDPKGGKPFLTAAFIVELEETGSINGALRALRLTTEDVNRDKRIREALLDAIQQLGEK